MNWLTKQWSEFVGDLILDFIKFFQDGVVKIFTDGTGFAEKTEVVTAVNAATLIACALIVVFVGKEVMTTHVMLTDGDPDSDPMQLIVKAAQVVFLICCNDIIFDFMVNFAEKMATDMNASVTPKNIFVNAENYIASVTVLGVMNGIFILIYLIFTLVLALKAGIRGVELAFMKILWPFFSLDILTVSAERWNTFFSSYVVTFLGYILQLIAFNMSITEFVKAVTQSFASMEYFMAAAWLYFALTTPKWLEKFAYSSGLSKVARGGFGGMMQAAYLARMAK